MVERWTEIHHEIYIRNYCTFMKTATKLNNKHIKIWKTKLVKSSVYQHVDVARFFCFSYFILHIGSHLSTWGGNMCTYEGTIASTSLLLWSDSVQTKFLTECLKCKHSKFEYAFPYKEITWIKNNENLSVVI